MANEPFSESLGQLMQSIVDLVGADAYASAADLFNEAKAKKTDFRGVSTNSGQQTFLPISFRGALHELSPRKLDRDWSVKSLRARTQQP